MGGVSYEDQCEYTSSDEDQARTVVLVGKTGNGKSSTGNSIIGKKAFKSKFSSGGVTTTCEMQTTLIVENKQILTVIDTPGLFDYSGDVEHIGKEIVKCIDMAKDGVHAFIVVLSVKTRFSREEEGVIKSLRKFFGDKISSYMIVVFTGGDELEDETLEDYLRGSPRPLKETLEMCGNRCLLFDNKTENEAKKCGQLKELLALVDVVLNNNGGKPYTDELFAEVKKHKFLCVDGEINNSQGSSKQDMSQFKEQLNMINEMVELKLRITTRWLEEQLAKEHAARLTAEVEAKDALKKSCEEMCILKAKLEMAQKETVAKADDAQKKFDEEMKVLRDKLERAEKEAEELRREQAKREEERKNEQSKRDEEERKKEQGGGCTIL